MYGSGWNSKNSGRLEKETFFFGFTRAVLGLVINFAGTASSSRKNMLIRGDDAALLLEPDDVLEQGDRPGELGVIESEEGDLALSTMLHSVAVIRASASA
jgi:hypothetical protein